MAAITNGEIHLYFKEHGKNKTLEYIKGSDLSKASCASACSSTFESVNACASSYDKSLKTVLEKITKLNKSKHRSQGAIELREFLGMKYNFPRADLSKRLPHVSGDDSLDIKQSLVSEIQKGQKLTEKLIESEKNVQEKVKVLTSTNSKLKSYQLKLKRTAARESYAQNKILKLEEHVTGECCQEQKDRVRDLEKQLLEAENKVKELSTSCEYLQDLLNENNENVLIVFDEKSKRYIPSFKNCVYELLKLNVSVSKVGDVVRSVLHLVNTKPNRLPSKPTVLEMNLQRLCLAQQQLSDIFSSEKDTCLLTDETSKFGAKYMGYEAADSSGNLWVLGLRDIETKSADDTLKVFKQILSDLDTVSEGNAVSNDIISHISATMSDRAATELKFNDLLESYRKEVLPLTFCNYDRFTDAEKSSIESLNNFFCGLHALVNYAETSQKCMIQVDQEIFDENQPIFDGSYKQKSEPGSCRLIRTASKAFGEGSGGDEKSGCQGNFKIFISDFLKDKHMRSVPLRSYRGAKFNILFSNACAVFYLHDQMIQFLEQYGAENRLLKSVLFDLKVPEYLAGVKALGLINKLITGPLWSVIEDKQVSIEDMNIKYLQLTTYFEDACNNVEQFMTGNLLVFAEHVVRDCFFDKLILPQPYDQIVQTYLEVILSALCKLGKKLYKDHLPGGKFTTAPIKAKSAPKTSCFAESVFGQMDQMMRTKPNVSTLAAEASIMFANNRTLEWLNSKPTEERDECIKKVSRLVPSLRRKFKGRLAEITENRKRVMDEKIRLRDNAQREKLRKQETYTTDIMIHGLWQSRDEIDRMLETYETKTQKVEALKTQLKFRKEVLLQIPDTKASYNFTKSVLGKKSRKSLSPEELTENLKLLVQQAVVKDHESDATKHMLVGKRIRHRFNTEDNGRIIEKWYTGKVISQVPWFPEWFNVVYDEDSAVYTLKHLPSIGRAITQKLVELGAETVALSRTQADLDSLKKEFPMVTTVQCDLRDWDKTREIVQGINNVDLLVNNAGVASLDKFLDVKKEDLDFSFDVNFKAVFNVSQAIATSMVERGVGGVIVNISSVASMLCLKEHAVYGSTKAAVDHLTKTMAMELGPRQIRVNAVNPTVAMTPMGIEAWSDPAKADPMLARIPMGRFLEVSEIVDGVMFLLSDKASMINGVTLPIEGGTLTS